MRSIISTVVFALQICRVFAQTGVYVPELQAFDVQMNNLLQQYSIPGGQLAITYQGRLIYNRGFGNAKLNPAEPVLPSSTFRIASVSKCITSWAILKLVESGVLNLNDFVFGNNGILNQQPYQIFADSRVSTITIRHLLNHSGGWNRDLSGDPMFNAYAIAIGLGVSPPANDANVIQYVLQNNILDFQPGSQYQYSNFGFCILGKIIEQVTGLSYEEFVKNTLLNPAGISTMHLGKNLEQDAFEEEVKYYDFPGAPYYNSVYDNQTQVASPYGGFNIEAMGAHGGWISTAADLCKLMLRFDGFPMPEDFLPATLLNEMVAPSTTNTNYGLGISVNSNNNWWHMGSLPGTTSELVRTASGFTWALLFNSRPADPSNFNNAVDNLVWNTIPLISNWPQIDLYTSVQDALSNESGNLIIKRDGGHLILQSNSLLENVRIVTAAGALIFENRSIDSNNFQIDLSKVKPGLLLISYSSNKDKFYRKINW